MTSQRRSPTPLAHPRRDELDLLTVLHALSDPTRAQIVQTLVAEPEKACGTFPVDVAASTLTHHFKVLREAGVIHQRQEGVRRWTTLRHDDLNDRFPGLLDAVLTGLATRSGE